MSDGYTKGVATTFSGTIRDQFPEVKNMTVTQTRERPTTAIITGGRKGSVRKALEWALRSCDGKGLKPYTPAKTNPFLEAHHDKVAAEVLKMPAYASRVEAYIQARLTKNLSTEEVKGLHEEGTYLGYRLNDGIPAGELAILLGFVGVVEPTYVTLIEHVANRTITDMQKRYEQGQIKDSSDFSGLKNNSLNNKRTALPSDQYNPVRQAFAEPFGKGVNEIITEWQESVRATRRPAVIHKTVSATPVRNTGKYRHKLDLAEIGVTSRSYAGRRGRVD